MRFYERFEQLCKEKGIKPTPATVEAGCSKGSASYWKRKYLAGEDALPDTHNAQALARYFSVSVDYLLGRTDIATDFEEKAWQDDEVMAAVNDGFKPLFNGIAKALNDADAFETKMTFDALVELRHYLSLIAERKRQADASLSLLQYFLGTGGRFVDICASITDETAEKPRLERAKQIAMTEYAAALDESLQILLGKTNGEP